MTAESGDDMCLLTFIPAGKYPDLELLESGADNNPDGHGFAIVTDDRQSIIVGRGLNDEDVLAEFAALRSRNMNGPALFHSRIGTAGLRTTNNCHPFYVGADTRTVLAHNGILPGDAQPAKEDYRSDTRLLAEVLLPKGKLGKLISRRGRKRLAAWMGAANKIVVLTVNPAYRNNAFILNASQGDWVGGIWYSNPSYKANYYRSGWSQDWKDYDWDSQAYDWEKVTNADGTSTWYARSKETQENFPSFTTAAKKAITDGKLVVDAAGRMPEQGDIDSAVNRWRAENAELPYADESDSCLLCGARHSLNAVTGRCGLCKSCNHCGEDESECLCYLPERERRLAEDVREIGRLALSERAIVENDEVEQ
jgi:predicted glutamine amidotransferase